MLIKLKRINNLTNIKLNIITESNKTKLANIDQLEINYMDYASAMGNIFLASSKQGVCSATFIDADIKPALESLQHKYPKHILKRQSDSHQQNLIAILNNEQKTKQINLHLQGTSFQLKVWLELLNIPYASLTTYQEIAQKIQHPKAYRAVGSAIRNNPIAYIIPCHRVINANGKIGQYSCHCDDNQAKKANLIQQEVENSWFKK